MKMNYYVYVLTNQNNHVMYIGMTNDLKRRVYEHINEIYDGFTKKYHIHKLVYFEKYFHPQEAILREKQLKHWSRDKKIALIEKLNPKWDDLLHFLN